jgi:hypothetical protein
VSNPASPSDFVDASDEQVNSQDIKAAAIGNQNLEVALALARDGLAVFPCQSSGNKAKRPCSGLKWSNVSTSSEPQIRTWWRTWPSALPALDCAKARVIVVDCDTPERKGGVDGVVTFRAEADKNNHVLHAPVVTPSGGHHYIFRQPEGRTALGCAKGRLGKMGCDVKGDGGYVIAPGSIMGDGTFYDGMPDWAKLPECPQWVIDLIETAEPKPNAIERPHKPVSLGPATTGKVREKWVHAAIDGELRAIASAPKGSSNDTLNASALRIMRLAIGIGMSRSEVEAHVEHAAWSNAAIQKDGRYQMMATIKSALDAAERMGAADDTPEEEDNVVDLEQMKKCVEGMIRNECAKKRAARLISSTSAEPWAETSPAEELPATLYRDFTITTGKQLIRKWLPASGLIVDGGKSQAGKTYAILDMCICLAGGSHEWCGEPIREKIGVVYIAGEGQATLQRRFVAAADARGVSMEDLPIAVTNWNYVDALNGRCRAAIMATIEKLARIFQEQFGVRLGLIVFDTARATADMKDEKDNSEVSRVLKIFRSYGDAFECATLAVHHVGKADNATLSGAGAWVSNADHCRLFLHDPVNPGDPITGRHIALAKSRISEIGAKYSFELRSAYFFDEAGQPATDEYGDRIEEARCEWFPYVEPEQAKQEEKQARGLSPADVRRARAEDARNTLEECYLHVKGVWKPSELEPQPFPGAVPLKFVRKRFIEVFVSDHECEEVVDADGNVIEGSAEKAKGKIFDNAKAALIASKTYRHEKLNSIVYIGRREKGILGILKL